MTVNIAGEDKVLSDNYLGTHDAGPGWVNYGPGILRTGRSLVLMDTHNYSGLFDRYVITDKHQNFERVEKWLSEHLQYRLNLTTNVAYCAVKLGCDFILPGGHG
jgi:hypothetical protein